MIQWAHITMRSPGWRENEVDWLQDRKTRKMFRVGQNYRNRGQLFIIAASDRAWALGEASKCQWYHMHHGPCWRKPVIPWQPCLPFNRGKEEIAAMRRGMLVPMVDTWASNWLRAWAVVSRWYGMTCFDDQIGDNLVWLQYQTDKTWGSPACSKIRYDLHNVR